MQFGKHTGKILFSGSLSFVKSKKTCKIRNVYSEKDHVVSLRASDGLFTLKLAGGRRLHDQVSSPPPLPSMVPYILLASRNATIAPGNTISHIDITPNAMNIPNNVKNTVNTKKICASHALWTYNAPRIHTMMAMIAWPTLPKPPRVSMNIPPMSSSPVPPPPLEPATTAFLVGPVQKLCIACPNGMTTTMGFALPSAIRLSRMKSA